MQALLTYVAAARTPGRGQQCACERSAMSVARLKIHIARSGSRQWCRAAKSIHCWVG